MPGEEQDKLYNETLDYLANLTRFGMNLGLQRIQGLLESLHNPQRQLRVIHVGGTNGKGSTAVIIAEILRAAGYKTGIFTSPHLHDYRERFVINGEMISRSKVTRLVAQLKPHLQELVTAGLEHPTEFEVHTAMALSYFAEEHVDFAVMEVGLGGKIDSTNVVSPLVSVITNVGRDHMDYLGEDLTAISQVKAGIIKPGSVAVTAAERPEVLAVLTDEARRCGVRLWQVGKDVYWKKRWNGEVEQEFDLFGLQAEYPCLHLRLMGEHQLRNAATAVTVCEILSSEYGAVIPPAAIYKALGRVQWPGRLELLSHSPKVLLDGAHNVDGAEMLSRALPQYTKDRLILCIGILADKEREKIMNLLLPLADEVVITKPESARAGDWSWLAKLAENQGKPVICLENPREAANTAYYRLRRGDMLCITGSLYMLAAAREELLKILNKS
ncbi:MAG TPA: folylpolyglutamate synthase/dihydrofolate synthase family protein [Desulfitobacteriaceae bacterium]|nr:folylpolyglutamate synthase/dihydrofolate synthase family protein [Desulfitobacteriaceae bacterium]